MEGMERGSLLSLPNELLHEIFRHFSILDLPRLAPVCRRIYALAIRAIRRRLDLRSLDRSVMTLEILAPPYEVNYERFFCQYIPDGCIHGLDNFPDEPQLGELARLFDSHSSFELYKPSDRMAPFVRPEEVPDKTARQAALQSAAIPDQLILQSPSTTATILRCKICIGEWSRDRRRPLHTSTLFSEYLSIQEDWVNKRINCTTSEKWPRAPINDCDNVWHEDANRWFGLRFGAASYSGLPLLIDSDLPDGPGSIGYRLTFDQLLVNTMSLILKAEEMRDRDKVSKQVLRHPWDAPPFIPS